MICFDLVFVFRIWFGRMNINKSKFIFTWLTNNNWVYRTNSISKERRKKGVKWHVPLVLAAKNSYIFMAEIFSRKMKIISLIAFDGWIPIRWPKIFKTEKKRKRYDDKIINKNVSTIRFVYVWGVLLMDSINAFSFSPSVHSMGHTQTNANTNVEPNKKIKKICEEETKDSYLKWNKMKLKERKKKKKWP